MFFSRFLGMLGGRFLEDVDVVQDGRCGVDVFHGVAISDFWHFNVIVFFDI